MHAAEFRRRLRQRRPVLYAILDSGVCSDPLADAAALIGAGVDCLQVRAKALAAGELVRLVEQVVGLAGAAGVAVFVNDRVDIAALAGADGAHVGAADLPPAAARHFLGPDRILGVTVHGPGEVAAVPAEVDFLGVGAMFPTTTRAGAELWGVAGLTEAGSLTTLPLIAVGGITLDNLVELQGAGLAGVAVASALTPASLHPGAVAAFREALDRW